MGYELFLIFFFFFFKQKTAYEMLRSLVGSEMCIRDRSSWSHDGHRVERERAVCGHDRQALDLRLRDQQSIEWISVMRWQGPDMQRVRVFDRKPDHAARAQSRRDVSRRRFRQRQLAKRVLDRDLPGTGCGQEQIVTGIEQQVASLGTKAGGLGLHPQPALGIEQKLHGSKSARTSSGSGWSNSSGTVNQPTLRPSCRVAVTA